MLLLVLPGADDSLLCKAERVGLTRGGVVVPPIPEPAPPAPPDRDNGEVGRDESGVFDDARRMNGRLILPFPIPLTVPPAAKPPVVPFALPSLLAPGPKDGSAALVRRGITRIAESCDTLRIIAVPLVLPPPADPPGNGSLDEDGARDGEAISLGRREGRPTPTRLARGVGDSLGDRDAIGMAGPRINCTDGERSLRAGAVVAES